MKITPARRKMLDFMSGTGGRLVRGIFGVLLAISGVTMGGWYWLLVPMGLFMIATGVMNYCPAVLAFPQYKAEKITEKHPTYKLDK
jgi:predicted phage tail protein